MYGLGETTLRVITGVLAVVFVLVVVWVMGKYFLKSAPATVLAIAGTPTLDSTVLPISTAAIQNAQTAALQSNFGIFRMPQIHTNIPSKPRTDVISYVVKEGDTLFGIADAYGLKPESLLWSNRYILGDNPDNLVPDLKINVPPEDGAIYEWQDGDGLNGVAKFYEVSPDDIVNWAGNHLDKATLGDYSLPNIAAGTMLFIPNGTGQLTDWLPHFTRDTPAEATSFGPGFCGAVQGPVGTGDYVWPTTLHYLSGYDYTSIHHGIDIAGKLDYPVYAADGGVIVYAGWSNVGYGNLIIVDHGSGWQSVYGHLDQILITCGQAVSQGEQIGLLGTTGNSSGPHLHFELRKDGSTVNPWDFLPAP
jgi:murein DD-endopeptidase MepM/ murein hydrolase activator NlpD